MLQYPVPCPILLRYLSCPTTINAAPLVSTSGVIRILNNSLFPGVVGLFVQGLETSLVLMQLATWFSIHEYTKSLLILILTVFVKMVGLLALRVSCHGISPCSQLLLVGRRLQIGFCF